MGDLQGPKIRIARFTDKLVQLQVGQPFTLSRVHPKEAGTASIVGIDYPELVQDCRVGDELLLDDGRVVLVVDSVEGDEVRTTVTVGGPLSNNKGINRRGGGLSAPSLTDKDRVDIKLAAEMELDYVAVSFPRYGSDIDEARTLLHAAGSDAWIIAKIERAEAVADDEALDALIRASDGVMVARGDLGVEVGDAELVGIQKRIIQHARTLNKVVITATQMMESMISSPMPTRAKSPTWPTPCSTTPTPSCCRPRAPRANTRSRRCRPWRASAWARKSTRPRPSRTIAWARPSRVATRPSRWPPCTRPTTSPSRPSSR